MSNFLSDMPLGDWLGNLTTFASFYDPLPADELEDATFSRLVNYVASSSGPVVGADKATLPFVIPCLLKVATLTAKMQAKTGRVEGRQRSSAHVTTATWLIIDVEVADLTRESLEAVLAKLKAMGISHVCFSTHSCGGPKGVRARLVIPVDAELDAQAYTLAWRGADQILFNGGAYAADASGADLWQQQGISVAHPDRVESAFRYVHKAGIAAADALIAEGRKVVPEKVERPAYVGRTLSASEQVARLEAALPFIDSETTSTWFAAVTAFKAVAPLIGHDDAQELAVRYSEQASDESKANNDDPRYDPATFFDNVNPTMPPEAGMGVLCGVARDGAVAALVTGFRVGRVDRDAAKYLCRFHHHQYRKVCAEHGLEVK